MNTERIDTPRPSDRPTEIPEFDLQKFAKRDLERATAPAVKISVAPRNVADDLETFSTTALEKVPSATIGGPPIHDLRLDHWAGFILSLIDGTSPVSTILDMCPLPRAEALAVIFGLVEDRIIVLSEAPDVR